MIGSNTVPGRIITLSANGHGAGKTTLAEKLCLGEESFIFSIADAVRMEMQEKYPHVDFFDKSPEGKIKLVPETGSTVRQLLILHGQLMSAADPNYWIDKAIQEIDRIQRKYILSNDRPITIVVDDMRKSVELAALRRHYGTRLLHLHLMYPGAVPEPHFDAPQLEKLADYIVLRGHTNKEVGTHV